MSKVVLFLFCVFTTISIISTGRSSEALKNLLTRDVKSTAVNTSSTANQQGIQSIASILKLTKTVGSLLTRLTSSSSSSSSEEDSAEDDTLTTITNDANENYEYYEDDEDDEDDEKYEDNEGYTKVVISPVISTPEECYRDCNEDWSPRICHYTFTLEHYTVLNLACDICTPNATNVPTSDCQCVQADGVERAIISTNRMLPGPAIQVCENDWVVVDVDNHLQGNDVTIHWHGILHKGSQFYDGVPFVTQCPIQSGNKFRYQFQPNRGTHFWHSHTGLQKLDGMYGSLIVRQKKSLDPNSYLYDQDLHSHVMLLGDWSHELAAERFPGSLYKLKDQHPISMLINGRGQFENTTTGEFTDVPLEVFTVTPGQRYRFRMINSFASVCGARLTVEGHKLTLIATDGDEIEPVEVDDIISFSGERYDFVINANNRVGTYWIQVRALGECGTERVQQLAILRYEGGPEEPASTRPTYDKGLAQGVTMNPLDAVCDTPRTDAVCVNQLKNAREVDERILHSQPDVKIYLPFRFSLWDNEVLFQPNTYHKYLVNSEVALMSLIDEITYKSSPSPLLSQYKDIDLSTFCNGDNKTDCGDYCSCTHKIDVPLNALVEIVLVDEVQIANMSHPFHLHGHTFNVIGMGRSPDSTISKINLNHVIELDRQGLLERHLLDDDLPAAKDTVAVPNNGYLVLRFIADNPGFWLFHCHFLFHVAIGMELVIQVGTLDDLPPVPANFPTCGDYLPPIIAVN